MTTPKASKLRPWVMLPTQWIQDGRLKEFRWLAGRGADNAAALMTLMVMAHHAARETGEGDLTYGQLSDFTSLSRAKVSAGLKILEERQLVTRKTDGRSSYLLTGYNLKEGWGKLPAGGLYSHERVAFFAELHLRSRPSSKR